MCGVVCAQLAHFSIGDWKDKSIAHVIIKSEVSTFRIVFIFFLGCEPDVCFIIFCRLSHIHSGKTGNLFSLLLCSLWWVQIIGYVMACRSFSFICTWHHLITMIVQTYLKTLNLQNACQIYFVACVSKIKHVSVIHCAICGAQCFRFTYYPSDDWGSIMLCLIIIKSGVWTITHCLELGHEKNGMCCMSFYILKWSDDTFIYGGWGKIFLSLLHTININMPSFTNVLILVLCWLISLLSGRITFCNIASYVSFELLGQISQCTQHAFFVVGMFFHCSIPSTCR